MKKLYLLLFCLIWAFSGLLAQSPLAFKYQAVARDANGQMYANQMVSLQFLFHEDSENGIVRYAEALQTQTSDFGKFAHDLGTGGPISGLPHDFSGLDWANHQYFLRVKLIVGGNEELIGVSQLLSVPYALYALQSGQGGGDDDPDPTNEIQQLSLNGNTLQLNPNGGSVDLPVAPNYTAGPGIQITGAVISNTGDPDPSDDLTNTSNAGGDISGVYSNLQINAGAVGSAELEDGAVTGTKIAQQSAATGQVLKWDGASWVPANDNGDSYSAGPGIDISGSTISNTGDPDPDDDLTNTSNAGGDVSGVYSNLQINAGAVTGDKIAQAGASTGQVLQWNGTTWIPADVSGDGWGGQIVQIEPTLGGDGTPSNPLRLSGQGASTGQILKWDGSSWTPQDDGFGGNMNGDVDGPIGSNEVTALRGRPLGGMPPTGANAGFAYVYDGAAWQLDTLQGDIQGRLSGATVTALRGRPLGGMPPTGANAGYAYVYDGTTWQLDTLQGDIQGRLSGATVTALRGRPLGGMPPTGANAGYAYVYDGATWQLDTLQGDITGTFTSATVSRIQNLPVDFSSGIGDGMVLTCVDNGGGLQFECRTPNGGGFSLPYSNSVNLNTTMFSLNNNFNTSNESVVGLNVSHRGPFAIKGSTDRDYSLFNLGGQGSPSTQLSNKSFYYPAGIYGENTSTNNDFAGAGVLGRAIAGNDNNRGVGGWFQGNSVGSMSISYKNGFASVVGYADQSGYAGYFKLYDPSGNGQAALYAESTNPQIWAGSFYGSVKMTGNLQVGNNLIVNGGVSSNVKNFLIDHPLDPANKFLVHTSVESPDMKNIYDGVVQTGPDGLATVQLPSYFDALNMDFRYQLTVIGQFAQAIIYEKIENNRFVIRTDKPDVEVSWQVTGIRKDPWAEANRTVVEPEKSPGEKGLYVNPEIYDQPNTMRIQFKKTNHQ
ncbi:MAG: hypothetical protein H6575_11850 [Lewinellaceae bacterium]|nr:hypothetical protein [Lewinellaceae bacterium]